MGPNFHRSSGPTVKGYTAEPLAAKTAEANVASGEAQRFVQGLDTPGSGGGCSIPSRSIPSSSKHLRPIRVSWRLRRLYALPERMRCAKGRILSHHPGELHAKLQQDRDLPDIDFERGGSGGTGGLVTRPAMRQTRLADCSDPHRCRLRRGLRQECAPIGKAGFGMTFAVPLGKEFSHAEACAQRGLGYSQASTGIPVALPASRTLPVIKSR